MRGLTLRRHYFFSPATAARLGGELAGADAWDSLRTGEAEPDFAMASTRDRWQADCRQPALVDRGRRIAALAGELGLTEVASFGVGTGCLEYQVHLANPALALHLSDFSGETVRLLEHMFPEAASVVMLDMLAGEIPTRPQALALLHRIDSEFAAEELRAVFIGLRQAGHRFVLVVPTMLLTPRVAIAELSRRVVSRIRRRPATFVGYARSKGAFGAIWGGVYAVRQWEDAGGSPLILLEAV